MGMIWQDAVMGAIQLSFIISLIPTLRAPVKPPLSTSLPTGAALWIGAATVFTLGLYGTAGAMAVAGGQWLALAWQEKQIRRARG